MMTTSTAAAAAGGIEVTDGDDRSQWDREPRWRTNDDQESYQRWDYSDRNYSNYWSADQRWDDDRSSYWHGTAA